MAKVQLGPLVGQVSGSVGGTVFSHNRAGTYIRRRSHPTVSQSANAMAAKDRLSSLSRAWNTLTDDQRKAWVNWAANNPVTDKLGSKQTLAGNAAYIMLNGRLMSGGFETIDVPPIEYAPTGLETVSLVANIGDGNVELDFTASPQPAGNVIYLWAAVTGGASQEYVKSKLRLLGVSAAPATSPMTTISVLGGSPISLNDAMVDRFGELSVGNLVTVYASVLDSLTGLLSTPRVASATVVDTLTGVVRVTIEPQGAIDAGAKWLVDSEITEHDSGALVTLAAGSHTVKFKVTAGYTKPADQTFTVATGHEYEKNGLYVAS